MFKQNDSKNFWVRETDGTPDPMFFLNAKGKLGLKIINLSKKNI